MPAKSISNTRSLEYIKNILKRQNIEKTAANAPENFLTSHEKLRQDTRNSKRSRKETKESPKNTQKLQKNTKSSKNYKEFSKNSKKVQKLPKKREKT